jgi:hypothetical protein
MPKAKFEEPATLNRLNIGSLEGSLWDIATLLYNRNLLTHSALLQLKGLVNPVPPIKIIQSEGLPDLEVRCAWDPFCVPQKGAGHWFSRRPDVLNPGPWTPIDLNPDIKQLQAISVYMRQLAEQL